MTILGGLRPENALRTYGHMPEPQAGPATASAMRSDPQPDSLSSPQPTPCQGRPAGCHVGQAHAQSANHLAGTCTLNYTTQARPTLVWFNLIAAQDLPWLIWLPPRQPSQGPATWLLSSSSTRALPGERTAHPHGCGTQASALLQSAGMHIHSGSRPVRPHALRGRHLGGVHFLGPAGLRAAHRHPLPTCHAPNCSTRATVGPTRKQFHPGPPTMTMM